IEELGVEAGGLHHSTLGRQAAAQHCDAAVGVHRVVQGADDAAVDVRRADVCEVLGHGLTGDGQRIAVQQSGVQQGAHDHRYAPDPVDVGHDVLAEGLEVAQVRDLV